MNIIDIQKGQEMETNNIPDSRGSNFFTMDPYSGPLLKTYLPASLYAHLLPVFNELGAAVGSRLDELADTADKNPPQLSVRNRQGQDACTVTKHPAYVELEKMAYEKLGLAAMSHRPACWTGINPFRLRPSTRCRIYSCRPSSGCAARSA
ncbi:acyl-CoA dehydrogenase [Advenella kashmirensis WT001]|uniref:Acyl-CoA dehydrogenase n=1 Tax=Advenella kashmirensis (strain DSM 17095 / LMG 22695 / WT001) TaxID=1036672 RepID=I3UD96_ADVKW|nr:acyl-CoA dehydrogenase [Advenella kashmirensis WT001]